MSEADHQLAAIEGEAETSRPGAICHVFDLPRIWAESFRHEVCSVRQLHQRRRIGHAQMLRVKARPGVVHSHEAEVELAFHGGIAQRPQ